MKKAAAQYIPGVCNIGPAEIRLRKIAGIGGAVFVGIFWLVFVTLNTPDIWRLSIFIPAFLSSIGFLQASLHFCVNFALRGLFNVSDAVKKEESVDSTEFRKKDQQKALILIAGSALISAAVAAAAYFLM